MLLVLVLAGAIWGLGAWMGAPRRQRWMMIAILWAFVVLTQLVLPDGNGLREATGGTAAPWLLLAGAVALGPGLSPGVAAIAGPCGGAGAGETEGAVRADGAGTLCAAYRAARDRRAGAESLETGEGAGDRGRGAGLARDPLPGGCGRGADRGDRRRRGGCDQPATTGDTHRCADRHAQGAFGGAGGGGGESIRGDAPLSAAVERGVRGGLVCRV